MNPKTSKLLEQAGKYVRLGRFTLALEQYQNLHQSEPEDTTIINTIGDLYDRLGDKQEASHWYLKLGETFEARELFANAIAAYKKILRFSPKNPEALQRLAQLYARLGQGISAKPLYQIVAHQCMISGRHEEALSAWERALNSDPTCHETQLELARLLEEVGKERDACEAYLKCGTLLVQKGIMGSAGLVLENIFRLKPQDRDFVKSLFTLLHEINLADRGLEYLRSCSLHEDLEFKAILGEVFLQNGNLEAAQEYLQQSSNSGETYLLTLELLRKLIIRKDTEASLNVADSILETSVQLRDGLTLKRMLEDLLDLDKKNSRTLKTLTTLLLRLNDREGAEDYSRRLLIVELSQGSLVEARDGLNKMAVSFPNPLYLDLSNLLNDALVEASTESLQETRQRMVRALAQGFLETQQPDFRNRLDLGASTLDLGMGGGTRIEMSEDLMFQSA